MPADGLVLRALHDTSEIDRLVDFHSGIFGPGLGALAQGLLRRHPQAEPSNWLFVEDPADKRIVSGLCLLPWQLNFGGVALRSGEMGIVATDERYRRRGLIAALNQRFDELLHAGDYDISMIQGIAYFYRQFDYHYALPLEAWCRVELHQFTNPAAGTGYRFRQASHADSEQLAALYQAAAADLAISTQRSTPIWEYLLGAGLQTETAGETWLISRSDDTPVGYVRVMQQGFGDGLICGEASQLGAEEAEATLHWLADLARERGKPYLRLNLPRTHILNRMAQSRGAGDWSAYAWQIRILNPQRFLHKLAPVFEQRLAASAFRGLSRDVTISFYRTALCLHFEAGRLREVSDVSPSRPAQLRLPPDLFAPLLFGWRTLEELRHIHPDAAAEPGARLLIETLFPRLEAFLYSIY